MFIDYSKALDSVQHYHLLKPMLKMGFPKHLASHNFKFVHKSKFNLKIDRGTWRAFSYQQRRQTRLHTIPSSILYLQRTNDATRRQPAYHNRWWRTYNVTNVYVKHKNGLK